MDRVGNSEWLSGHLRLPPDRERQLPHLLAEGYDVTSPTDFSYNCIAFAADVNTVFWWPDQSGDGFWPIAWREVSVSCFVEAFRSIGYEICNNGGLELGYDKIALFILNGQPTHAAKQLPDGRWKSKLGRWEDIEHASLKAVEDHIYGKAEVFMRRKKGNDEDGQDDV